MPPTNHPHQNGVHGSRDSHVPNGRPTPMEVDRENGLTITASLSESPRSARRNQPVSSSECVTVSPRPGERPTTHTVLKQGNGEVKVVENRPHASNVQAAVNRQAEVLGTITIGETNDTFGGWRPVIPQQPQTFQIFVNNFSDSRNYTFEVQKSYRVDKLMDMIFYKLRIPKDQQHLTYAGKNLVAGMTLEHYDIKENSTICLTGRIGRPCISESKTFQIFVKNFSDSKNYTFEVQKSYRVEKLMDMIFDKLRIPKDQQLLTYAGRNLVAGMTLEHYDIKENSTVFMTGRLRGG